MGYMNVIDQIQTIVTKIMSNGDDLECEYSNPLDEIDICEVLQSEV